ncbi:unconventional myosin-VIIa-like isoform X2 [Branchiostoma lanceolatum]|uniref:unconventional myosin-VIIa-like isoform X2 n=1 Tax=Branchiostoma lanceolatum TaxID=7740 RepID=UPI0034529D29
MLRGKKKGGKTTPEEVELDREINILQHQRDRLLKRKRLVDLRKEIAMLQIETEQLAQNQGQGGPGPDFDTVSLGSVNSAALEYMDPGNVFDPEYPGQGMQPLHWMGPHYRRNRTSSISDVSIASSLMEEHSSTSAPEDSPTRRGRRSHREDSGNATDTSSIASEQEFQWDERLAALSPTLAAEAREIRSHEEIGLDFGVPVIDDLSPKDEKTKKPKRTRSLLFGKKSSSQQKLKRQGSLPIKSGEKRPSSKTWDLRIPISATYLSSAEEQQHTDPSLSVLSLQDGEFEDILEEGMGECLADYSFNTFALRHFHGAKNHSFTKDQLKHPLLKLKSEDDQQAALEVWVTIQKFMGDVADTDVVEFVSSKKPPIKRRMSFREFGAKITGKKKYDLSTENAAKEAAVNNEVAQQPEVLPPTSGVEKVAFITGYGIYSKPLRDEIYSQLMKQLTDNPAERSRERGWFLLALCAGCFAPSNLVTKVVRYFISGHAPPEYSLYCEERLRRTCSNGTRSLPPPLLEYNAVKRRRPIMVAVTLMDERVVKVDVDSATTIRELRIQLSEKISLLDHFGFAFYITMFDQTISLTSGSAQWEHHIMDAISHVEQTGRDEGLSGKDVQWDLFFRKEVFGPWHDPYKDPVGTTLIYHQLVGGLKYGEYKCQDDAEYAEFSARRFYIEHGPSISEEGLIEVIQSYVPDKLLKRLGAGYWVNASMNSFKKLYPDGTTVSSQDEKAVLVRQAMDKWAQLFSRFYVIKKMSGPGITLKRSAVAAVNWKELSVLEESDSGRGTKVALLVPLTDVKSVSKRNVFLIRGADSDDEFSVKTTRGPKFTFIMNNADEIQEMLQAFVGRHILEIHHPVQPTEEHGEESAA